MTLQHSGEMSIYLHSPYVTVLHRKMTESQPYTSWTTPSVTIARNSSEHVHVRLRMPKVLKVEILNILKLS